MRRIALSLCVLLVGAVFAGETDDQLSPEQSFKAMQKELLELRQNRKFDEYRKLQQGRPKEFLAKWEKAGAKATGEDRLYLAQFYTFARRHKDAMNAYRGAVMDETIAEAKRKQARVSCASALASAMGTGELSDEEIEAAIKECEQSVNALGADGDASLRATVLNTLGQCHMARHRGEQAIDFWMQAARASGTYAGRVGSSIMGALLEEALDLQKLGAVRERARKIVAELTDLQKQHAAKVRADGNERAANSADRMLSRIANLDKPFAMIGQPAPAWTLERALRGNKTLAEYKGKVVMLDFWATWCPWCIRSFPAIRDLLKDYKDKPFAVVGVTASAGVVYDARYDLDDDLKAKAQGRAVPVARMPRGGTEQEIAKYLETEEQTIAVFMKNHQMTWDVVKIDKTEPGPKYALTGWPHAVVVDKQGRVRYFKRGALLRDREAQVKKFRKVLDRLLAEK